MSIVWCAFSFPFLCSRILVTSSMNLDVSICLSWTVFPPGRRRIIIDTDPGVLVLRVCGTVRVDWSHTISPEFINARICVIIYVLCLSGQKMGLKKWGRASSKNRSQRRKLRWTSAMYIWSQDWENSRQMWQLKVRQQVLGDIQHGAFDVLVKHIEFRSGFVTGHVLQCCREHAFQTIWHTHAHTNTHEASWGSHWRRGFSFYIHAWKHVHFELFWSNQNWVPNWIYSLCKRARGFMMFHVVLFMIYVAILYCDLSYIWYQISALIPTWRPSTHSTHLIMYPSGALTKASQSLWGVDDALAILLALGSEQLQVDGLSIALGNCKDLLICREATWE